MIYIMFITRLISFDKWTKLIGVQPGKNILWFPPAEHFPCLSPSGLELTIDRCVLLSLCKLDVHIADFTYERSNENVLNCMNSISQVPRLSWSLDNFVAHLRIELQCRVALDVCGWVLVPPRYNMSEIAPMAAKYHAALYRRRLQALK